MVYLQILNSMHTLLWHGFYSFLGDLSDVPLTHQGQAALMYFPYPFNAALLLKHLCLEPCRHYGNNVYFREFRGCKKLAYMKSLHRAE